MRIQAKAYWIQVHRIVCWTLAMQTKRIPSGEYVNYEWYLALLNSGWFVNDWDKDTDELICLRLADVYPRLTVQQASLSRYRSVEDLTEDQIEILQKDIRKGL